MFTNISEIKKFESGGMGFNVCFCTDDGTPLYQINGVRIYKGVIYPPIIRYGKRQGNFYPSVLMGPLTVKTLYADLKLKGIELESFEKATDALLVNDNSINKYISKEALV